WGALVIRLLHVSHLLEFRALERKQRLRERHVSHPRGECLPPREVPEQDHSDNLPALRGLEPLAQLRHAHAVHHRRDTCELRRLRGAPHPGAPACCCIALCASSSGSSGGAAPPGSPGAPGGGPACSCIAICAPTASRMSSSSSWM